MGFDPHLGKSKMISVPLDDQFRTDLTVTYSVKD
jgi:hypothetical protein